MAKEDLTPNFKTVAEMRESIKEENEAKRQAESSVIEEEIVTKPGVETKATNLSQPNPEMTKSSEDREPLRERVESAEPPYEYPEPVRERTVIKEREVWHNPGCLPGCGCRTITCFGCMLPILLIVATALLLIFQPAVIWEPVKNLLNGPVNSEGYVNLNQGDSKDVSGKLAQAAQEQVSVEITEKELAGLLKSKFATPEKFNVDVTADRISLLANLEDDGSPLWGHFAFKVVDNKFKLADAGLGTITLPQAVVSIVQDALGNGLNIANIEQAGEIISELAEDEDITIRKVELGQDKVTLYL